MQVNPKAPHPDCRPAQPKQGLAFIDTEIMVLPTFQKAGRRFHRNVQAFLKAS
jgi:hypothetical protein